MVVVCLYVPTCKTSTGLFWCDITNTQIGSHAFVGFICMPCIHSNTWLNGVYPRKISMTLKGTVSYMANL